MSQDVTGSSGVNLGSGGVHHDAIALLRDSVLCWTERRRWHCECRQLHTLSSLNVAHTQQTLRADVMKTFDCDPSKVTQARAVVAQASYTTDTDAIGKEFERNPPDTFVVSLAADATQETLTLTLIQFHRLVNCTIDLENIGVIAAVLLVISRSSALGRLRCEPSERANVGSNCCCIAGRPLRGGHIKSITNFKAAGLTFALLSFVHFDLDGHGAKAARWESRDGAVRNVHVQATAEGVRRYMDASIGNMSTNSEAEEL